MEFMEAATSLAPGQGFYELVTWVTLIGINFIMLAFAYWLMDIAFMMQKRLRRWVTIHLAIICAGVGIWRMVVVAIYYKDFQMMSSIPITAALTWFVILLIGYSAHRYIRKVQQSFLARKENVELMQAVQDDIVKPLLSGDPITPELIKTLNAHKAASIAFSQKFK